MRNGMDPKEKRREIFERYARRVEVRRRVEQRGGKKIERGARRGVRPMMKRKDITPGVSEEECVVLERNIDKDRLAKSCNIESRVSNGDTSSSSRRGPGDPVRTPWLLHSATTLEEDEA
jgi:hypothetical protein